MTHKIEDNKDEAAKETAKKGISSMDQENVQVPKKTEEVVVQNIKDTTTDGASKISTEPKEDIIDRLEKVNDNESKHVVMLHNIGTRSHLQSRRWIAGEG